MEFSRYRYILRVHLDSGKSALSRCRLSPLALAYDTSLELYGPKMPLGWWIKHGGERFGTNASGRSILAWSPE